MYEVIINICHARIKIQTSKIVLGIVVQIVHTVMGYPTITTAWPMSHEHATQLNPSTLACQQHGIFYVIELIK